MAEKEKKKCHECYYYQGTCLCGDSPKYGSFILFKPCDHWCTHPDELKRKKDNNAASTNGGENT